MKGTSFEATIVAAKPDNVKTNSSFTRNTMRKLRARAAKPRYHNLFTWLGHLQKPALALLVVAALALLSGVVYAAILFAPSLIRVTGKDTNSRGATEYSVQGFADCAKNDYTTVDRFEVNSQAPKLTDDEVQKIVQAKCELKWLQEFPGKVWPTYGTNPEWKDGDTIYYTRQDVLGTLKQADENGAVVSTQYGDEPSLKTVPSEKLKAYYQGEEIPLGEIKPGDTVFTIVRVSERYIDYTKYGGGPGMQATIPPDNQMKVVGLVALFKLSLPRDYYGTKQNYLTEIPTCIGNETEYCPTTPYLDVYPRVGGEGAMNPYYTRIEDAVFRQISGTVTELNNDTLTLKTRKGNIYTVTVGDAGFKVYNRDYAGAYADLDAHLKVGSNVSVNYSQPKDADPKKITKEQISTVVLLLEALNPKKGNIKQY